MLQDLSTAAQIGPLSKRMFNIIAQWSKPIRAYDGSAAKANVSRSCFNTNRMAGVKNLCKGSLISHTTEQHTLDRVRYSSYQAMKLFLVFAFVFSLCVLTLLAESIPRQEDTQVLASKQNDPSVNYHSDSLNRLKREIRSGLLNNYCTQSPLIGPVIFLARRTQSLSWLLFFV